MAKLSPILQEFSDLLDSPDYSKYSAKDLLNKIQENKDRIEKTKVKLILKLNAEAEKAILNQIYDHHHQVAQDKWRVSVVFFDEIMKHKTGLVSADQVICQLDYGLVAIRANNKFTACESENALIQQIRKKYETHLVNEIDSIAYENSEINRYLRKKAA
jgi:hypothetical protein